MSATPPHDVGMQIDELRTEIKSLQRDLYGDPQIRQKGVLDRLEALEERLDGLRTTYEQEKIEQSYITSIEARLDGQDLKYATALIYLKGIAGGVGAIIVPLCIAVVLYAFRLFGGG